VYGKVIFISGPSRPRGPFEGLGQWYLDGRYQMAPRTATYLLEDQAVINEITQGGDGPSKPRGPFEGLGRLGWQVSMMKQMGQVCEMQRAETHLNIVRIEALRASIRINN